MFLCEYLRLYVYICIHISHAYMYIYASIHVCFNMSKSSHIHMLIYKYVTEVNMNITGMSTFLFPMEFFAFWQENTFITPLLMMSLHYVTNDTIMTS